jgi:serine/threonine protein phosphatase PrpC
MGQETSDNIILSCSRAYNKLQDELFKTNLFDVTTSGSTLLTTVVKYPKLVCANAGDSRAVLARKCKTLLI